MRFVNTNPGKLRIPTEKEEFITAHKKVILLHSKSNRIQLANKDQVEIDLNATVVDCDRYESLHAMLHMSPEVIVVDSGVATEHNISIDALATAIRTIATMTPGCDEHIKLIIVENSQFDSETVNKLMANVKYCWLTGPDSVDSTIVQAAHPDNTQYLYSAYRSVDEDASKPTLLYLRDNIPQSVAAVKISAALAERTGCNVKFCISWAELCSEIRSKPQHIMLHIDAINRSGVSLQESLMMIETLIKFYDLDNVNLGMSITKDTNYDTIKILQKSKVKVIIPAIMSWGVEEALRAIEFLTKGQTYYPRHIIDSLPGAVIKIKEFSNSNDIKLTDRQREVFDLIASRGLSNKQIARVLNISESTVKIHVSSILKTLCVRNRTQLALNKDKVN